MLGTIRRWVGRFFNMSFGAAQARRTAWPTREEIEGLPPFDAIGLDRIVQVTRTEDARRAYDELIGQGVVGFDTESKPVFRKGEISTGPHVAQFATSHRTFVFLLHDAECRRVAARLIASEALKKVGFGLSEDLKLIKARLRTEPREVVELERVFVEKGYKRGVGVKVGVALAMKEKFRKSKKASTSNWSRRPLTVPQLLYAANDAYAALRVFQTLSTVAPL